MGFVFSTRSRLSRQRFTNIFVLILMICFVQSSHLVYAQQLSLSLSPPIIEAVIMPDKSILIAYTLQNGSDAAYVDTYVRSFEPLGDKGSVKIKESKEGPIRFSLDNSNLDLEETFFLRSNESKQLLLSIRVPIGTPPGDYYYTFFAETKPQPSQEGVTSSLATGAIGANLILTVSNDGILDNRGAISGFDVFPQYSINLFNNRYALFNSGTVIPVRLTLSNLGKNVAKPTGTITMSGDAFNKTFEILPQNILAESQRMAIATPSASLNCKKGSANCGGDYSVIIPGEFMGKYTVSTNVIFGEGSEALVAVQKVYVVPITLLLGIGVSLVIGISVILTVRKMQRND